MNRVAFVARYENHIESIKNQLSKMETFGDEIVVISYEESKSLDKSQWIIINDVIANKENAFLLDMAGNLMEHGGLGTPYYEKARGEAEKPKGRICPACESFNKPTARECAECGFQFPEPETPKASHSTKADVNSNAVFQPLVRYNVEDVIYREHSSKKGNITIRVDYVCNANYGAISEWYSPYSDSDWARNKCWQFFKDRGWEPYGDIKEYKIVDLLWHADNLKKPISITVDHNEKFPRIISYEWKKETQSQENGGVINPTSSDTLDGDYIPDFWD